MMIKHFKILSYVSVAVLMITCKRGNESIQPERVWKMENGVVIFEVESVKEGGPKVGFWEMLPDTITGYTGTTAFIWKGDGNTYKDPLAIDAPKTDIPYKLSYKIWVENAGEYEIKIRNRHMLKDGDNDAWLSINKQFCEKIWDHDVNEWTWNEAIAWDKGYQPRFLNKGINTIDIIGRSKNWIIDRIAIVQKGVEKVRWSDPAIPESKLFLPGKEDHDPPSKVTNLREIAIGISYISLEWDKAVDNYEVFGYDVYLDSLLFTTCYDNRVIISGLRESTKYQISVQPKDFSGNKGEISEPINVSTVGFGKNQGALVPYADFEPLIDGEFEEEWNSIAKNNVNRLIDGKINSESDLSGSYRCAWNDKYFCFFLDVKDDNPQKKAGTYDGIQLFFDPDNSKDTRFSYNDRIYSFALSQPKKDGRLPISTALINRDEFVKGLLVESTVHQDGYNFECAIPWSTIGIKPYRGLLVGFDLVIKDYDTDSERAEAVISWFGKDNNAGTSPMKLGTLKLEGL